MMWGIFRVEVEVLNTAGKFTKYDFTPTFFPVDKSKSASKGAPWYRSAIFYEVIAAFIVVLVAITLAVVLVRP